MRWLLFLSRLAFICGVFFIIAVTLLIKKWVNDPTLESTIIIIGYVMGIFIFPATCICYIIAATKKKLKQNVPLWLILANIFFFLFLIFFIFYLNDPYYHQK